MKRIQRFLLCEEINPQLIGYNDLKAKSRDSDIFIKNAHFSWGGDKEETKEPNDSTKGMQPVSSKNKSNQDATEQNSVQKQTYAINDDQVDEIEEDKFDESITAIEFSASDQLMKCNSELDHIVQIKALSLSISKGEFVCVIGEVGSGKSSLLSAILGDMLYLDDQTLDSLENKPINTDTRHQLNAASMQATGVIRLGGSVSFVQQVPWIQNKTIRDNILFDEPLDERKYNRVVAACQLAADLEALPGGDLTEIGEKGINLSGGQKARISLARAAYADTDIVLLDDPISALDSNVKRMVVEQVLLGEMRHKTRLLVTHAVDFIDRADRIVVMEAGRVKHIGTYDELQHSDEIRHIIETLSQVRHAAGNEETKTQPIADDDAERSKSFVSAEGTNITDEENDEQIEVGW
eukprot:CAMPEP_0168334162 /NCGR_PEP_ID=MMETSP0213-20121227/10081_1 /TAXON_ID=151035 /ORGANISM="Euplotes harpa, Strain FSP1.4" /LENGTH=407 /DNA_ID=CAMNT_0008338709 /DNA_START=1185 /DNA_END=2405 /DNA_ORIENTATION=-